jgi:hypothetical protein
MAAVLKHLLRAWRVRAIAVLEAPPDPIDGSQLEPSNDPEMKIP